MIVIAKRDTQKLIKGHRYEVRNLWNNGGNGRWQEGKIFIEGIGKFSVGTFTMPDGTEVTKTNYSSPNALAPYQRFTFEELVKGDILVCKSDRYKTFVNGRMYKIIDLETITKQVPGWNGQPRTITDNYVRFEGISRKMKFNPWAFRKLNTNETREMQLSQILGEGEGVAIVTDPSSCRNIELVEDKDDTLLKNLAKSILDENRHHLSIVEWASRKVGDKLEVKSSDYEPYLNMTLSQILERIK